MNELCERDFGSFFAAPFDSYGEDPVFTSLMRSDFVRLLDGRKNPLFRDHGDFTYFSVRRKGRAPGRGVAQNAPGGPGPGAGPVGGRVCRF